MTPARSEVNPTRGATGALAGKTAFVTGATGFLGSHLAEALLEAGCTSVRCLVRTERKWLEGLPVEIVTGDLNDRPALERGVRGADFVFHVAALTRARTWDAFERANIAGTTRLLDTLVEARPDIERVVLTSSLAVVGRADTTVANEDTPLNPVSMYGRSKRLMEREARRYMDRLNLVIVRPPAVYGPRETDILTFFRMMKYGLCPIVGSGNGGSDNGGSDNGRLSLVHVDDVVRGMIRAALAPEAAGGTYFIGPPDPVTWRDVRDAVRRATGRPVLTVPVANGLVRALGATAEAVARPFGIYPPLNREKAEEITEACLICDSSLAVREIGYAPSVDLESGIRETIEWYRRHRWL